VKKIRFGIFGLGRGGYLVDNIFNAGADVVAICDKRPAAIATCKKDHPLCKNAAEYTDFEEFIKHDMDAVLLCNYFCDHAEYAIKCLKAGKHVLSETMSNVTMAEGVALCRAVEETGMTYALFENYPYFVSNLEMKRLYQSGELGELVYAEGEYVHPMDPKSANGIAPGKRHWRNWIPRSYYITHALAPLMSMTDALPTRVSSMASFHPCVKEGTACQVGDAAAIILCQTDIDAVFRIMGCAWFFPHGNYYRLGGTKGGVENDRITGNVRLFYHPQYCPEGKENINYYKAEWPDAELGKFADKAGHGGGDFLGIYDFVKDLEEGREPYWNVYRATAAASVGILAWRSILNGNAAYDIPDFRKEEEKVKYENDTASPFPDENYNTDIPCSSRPHTPTAEDLAAAEEVWKNLDYLYN